MRTFFLIIILTFSANAFASETDARIFLKQNNWEKAFEALDEINIRDSHFEWAIQEQQKINYRNSDWDRFFGYALFYRKKLMHIEEQKINTTMLFLESLALAKLCQFNAAWDIYSIFEKLEEIKKLSNEETQTKNEILNMIQIQEELHGNVKTNPKLHKS
jgi:hypothetical protein